MACVNTGYSDEAQKLKCVVINNCVLTNTQKDNSILSLRKHLKALWKAILQEDFVFSFKNMHEISAFKKLEEQFGEWSWSFKKNMIEWETTAENKIIGCATEELQSVYDDMLTCSLPKQICVIRLVYEAKMNRFFEEGTDIMLKWKHETETRFKCLGDELQLHAKNLCIQLFQSRRDRADIEEENKKLSVFIRKQVKELVTTLDRYKLGDKELIEIFEKRWLVWVEKLTATVQPLPILGIPLVVEKCLLSHFQTQQIYIQLKERLRDKPLKQCGEFEELKLAVKKTHIQISKKWYNIWPSKSVHVEQFIPLAQNCTNSILANVRRYLADKRQPHENFKPLFVTELLVLVQEQSANKMTEPKGFVFTEEYIKDMALTVCSYGTKVFEAMAEAFRQKHDPGLIRN